MRNVFVFGFLAALCASTAYANSDAPLSERYPATAKFTGPVHMPDFRGRDRKFADLHTRIREAIKAGPSFAGHYTIIGWGCGTECVDYVVADVATGQVFRFPLSGEDYGELQLGAKINSRLIVANWIADSDQRAPDNSLLQNCLRQSFVWTGDKAVPLGKPAVIATVKWHDSDICFGGK